MANGNRRPLAPVRKLFAAVLGTCALFVVLFGIGMKSLAIVALGIALIVLAVGLVLVTTIRGGARAWVAGTAHVHTVSEPPASSVFGRCELQVLIDAPGVAGRLVRMRDPRVPVAKWPDVGASLPIMVAIDDPRHIRILWDEVLTHAEAAADRDSDIGPLDKEDWDRPDNGYGAAEPVETIETTTADLTDELSGLRESTEPVVVHQTPGGPIVVEGTLVDPPEATRPLTRRARPDPRMTRAERTAQAETSGGTATATAPPPAPDVPGQRADAGSDDVFDFDQEATWAEPLFAERRVSRPARGSADTEVTPAAAASDVGERGSDAGDPPSPARTAGGAGGGESPVDDSAASGSEAAEEGWAPAGRAASRIRRDDDLGDDLAASGETTSRTEPGDDAGDNQAESGRDKSRIRRDDDLGDDLAASGETTSRIRRDDDLGDDLAASGGTTSRGLSGADAVDDSAAVNPAGDRVGDVPASAGGPPLAEAPIDAGPDRGIGGDDEAGDGVMAGAEVGASDVAADATGGEPPRPARGKDAAEDVFGDLFNTYPSARPGTTGATIHGVGLTFLVRDLPRSVAFYRDMLGFLEIDGGEHNAVLASGDTRMVLREIRDASPVNRRLVHLNLEVGDVMSVYEDLRAKGVRFTYPPRVVNRGAKLELWAAAFRDPDGHGIAITQWRSRETG